MKITGNKEQSAEYYDNIYKTVVQKTVPRQESVCNYIKTCVKHPSILDIGCGCGTFVRAMSHDWTYRGFDFSEEAIRQAKKHDYSFWVGNVFDHTNYLPLDYNVIVCGQVLEHVDDLALIKMFPRKVEIICTVPMFDDPAHVRYYESVADVHSRFNKIMLIKYMKAIGNNQILMTGFKP